MYVMKNEGKSRSRKHALAHILFNGRHIYHKYFYLTRLTLCTEIIPRWRNRTHTAAIAPRHAISIFQPLHV
jgi:hypothetical protein